jgi:hypothetical protein
VTTGVTTLTEVLRVLPHSALYRKVWDFFRLVHHLPFTVCYS